MSREEILKRRARFVSAALLLATGCTRAKDGASALPDTEAVKPVPPPPSTAPPAKVRPGEPRPILDAKVSAAGEPKLKVAKDEIEKSFAAIDKLAGSVPVACELGEKSCKERFRAFADEAARIRDDLIGMHMRCPPKAPDDKAIENLREEHRQFMLRWLIAIEKVAGETSDAGAEWEKLKHEAAEAHPQPCLKFACP